MSCNSSCNSEVQIHTHIDYTNDNNNDSNSNNSSENKHSELSLPPIPIKDNNNTYSQYQNEIISTNSKTGLNKQKKRSYSAIRPSIGSSISSSDGVGNLEEDFFDPPKLEEFIFPYENDEKKWRNWGSVEFLLKPQQQSYSKSIISLICCLRLFYCHSPKKPLTSRRLIVGSIIWFIAITTGIALIATFTKQGKHSIMPSHSPTPMPTNLPTLTTLHPTLIRPTYPPTKIPTGQPSAILIPFLTPNNTADCPNNLGQAIFITNITKLSFSANSLHIQCGCYKLGSFDNTLLEEDIGFGIAINTPYAQFYACDDKNYPITEDLNQQQLAQNLISYFGCVINMQCKTTVTLQLANTSSYQSIGYTSFLPGYSHFNQSQAKTKLPRLMANQSLLFNHSQNKLQKPRQQPQDADKPSSPAVT